MRAAKDTLEQTLWKMDLLNQAVRGIAHRGQSGDIQNVDDETIPAEDLIRAIKYDLEEAMAGLVAQPLAYDYLRPIQLGD
jgi:hypothetical protein